MPSSSSPARGIASTPIKESSGRLLSSGLLTGHRSTSLCARPGILGWLISSLRAGDNLSQGLKAGLPAYSDCPARLRTPSFRDIAAENAIKQTNKGQAFECRHIDPRASPLRCDRLQEPQVEICFLTTGIAALQSRDRSQSASLFLQATRLSNARIQHSFSALCVVQHTISTATAAIVHATRPSSQPEPQSKTAASAQAESFATTKQHSLHRLDCAHA
jgi:hypothetical protein